MTKEIAAVDLHHQVLIPWAQRRREHPEGPAPAVLCLDHHLDVVRAFRDAGRSVGMGCWKDPAAVRQAVGELRHDEHFDWAVRSGLVEKVVIASHTRFTPPANEHLIVRCDSLWPDENDFFQNMEQYRFLADSVLESAYLERQFGSLDEYGSFILDIDCDYFLTARALQVQDDGYFCEMVRKACQITLSLESDWVRILRLPGEILDAETVKTQLFSKINHLLT